MFNGGKISSCQERNVVILQEHFEGLGRGQVRKSCYSSTSVVRTDQKDVEN